MKKCVDKIACPFEKKIDEMHTDIKSLLKFKWQIMGGSAVISIVFIIVISLLKLRGM